MPTPVSRERALCKAPRKGYGKPNLFGAELSARLLESDETNMLEGIRRASKSLVGKVVFGILFGFLILSFAVWGIGDIFRGIGVSSAAKVGDVEISTEAYRSAYQTQLQNWQRESRRAITNDQARAAGLDKMVLSRLISEAALDQRARALGLAMAERDIAQAIVNDPTFIGPTGKFERQRFNDALREAGYSSEGRFVQEQRQVYLRRELALSIAGDVPLPLAMLEAVHQYDSETRSVEFFTLPASAAGEIPPPGEDALKTFYEERKASFRTPEYRKIIVLSVAPSSVADPARVTDADARQLYEQVKGQRFTAPERRSVQQIIYPDEAAAVAARKSLADGETFDALAQKRGLADKDIDLGALAWGEFADPNIAQAAFALAEGAVSEPVKGAFGFVLLRVSKVEPQSVKPFEEIAQIVKRELAERRSRDEIQKIRDVIENQRTSGKSLAEAAEAAKLTARVIEAVDQNGRNPDGAEVAGLVEGAELLRAVYASDIGVDNDLLTTRDNGYTWFEVAGIEPARDPALDEVRERVAAAWLQDEAERALQRKAQELVKRIEGGEPIEVVAKSVGLDVQLANDVKRSGSQTLPPAAVVRSFTIATEAAASTAIGPERIVFKVLDSLVPPYDPESATLTALAPRLREALTEDILAQFVAKAQDDLGVKINESAVRMAVGGQQN